MSMNQFSILSFVTYTINLQGWLLEKGGMMPQLPNETRWNSQLDCIESYLKNHSTYMEIRGEHMEDINENIGKLIDNVAIKREAMNLQSQLQIIGTALDKVFKYSAHGFLIF